MDGAPTPTANDQVGFMEFLRAEGLELLAIYRRIEDPEIRVAILRIMRALAGPEEP